MALLSPTRIPDPQVEVTSLACALRKPKAAASGAEGNPTGRFGPEWELPHAWGPGDLDFASDTARANWVGTSFAAAFASATAATTIQAFRDAQPSVPPGFPLQPLLGLPQEALRAALSASGGRLPIDHGVESCSEPLHKLAEQVDGVQAAAIVRNRAPRGSVPSQSGFDALTLTSADFSRCGSRPVPPNHPPNTTFCVAGPPTWWAMQSPGLRAGVSRVRLRVVLTWSVPQTCYLLQMCGRQGPAPESCLRRGVCASDASPPDLDLLVITPGGALAGPTTAMFEGTWETVDIDASVAGTYAVGVGLWNPNKLQAPIGSGFQVPIGLAWSLIEEPAP